MEVGRGGRLQDVLVNRVNMVYKDWMWGVREMERMKLPSPKVEMVIKRSGFGGYMSCYLSHRTGHPLLFGKLLPNKNTGLALC